MKLTKMSLVAALLVGSSAFAIDNVKVDGDAKLFYSTTSSKLKKDNSAGQAALGLGLSADLTQNVSAGAHLTALTTLGLQGQLVNNVWEGTNGVSDSWWFDQAWLATTVGKTTAKIGRMELDTPLVFTEKWSIAENTFEAAVLLNQDLPNTTIVAAYVGGSNGQYKLATATPGGVGINNVVQGMNTNGTTNFNQFYFGAYAVAVVNNSWKPLVAQAWYFQATHVTNAYWLQGDVDASSLGVKGLSVGLQITGIDKITGVTTKSSSAFALKAGYEMKDTFTASLAYSSVDKDAGAGFNLAGTGQSKLYTEAWWNYGYVTKADTTAINLTVTVPQKAAMGIADVGFYYTMADQSQNAGDNDLNEVAVTLDRSFGPLDVTVAGIFGKKDKSDTDIKMVQAYLTYNF